MEIKDLIGRLLSLINKAGNFKNQHEFTGQDIGEKPPKKRRNLKGILLLPLVVIAIFAIMSCQYTVEEAEQAVVTTLGKVTSVETAGPCTVLV